MILRPATRHDPPAVLALLADEERVVDPASVVDEAYERAFAAIDSDPRNEMPALVDSDAAVLGCLQLTYIPGLGKHGAEQALIGAVRIEALRIGAARRGAGLGRELMRQSMERARLGGCSLVQPTNNRQRADAHRFYESPGFARSHEGFKLSL